MQYMIFHYSDESSHADIEPGTPEFAEMMGKWMALNQSLIETGQFVGGASLVDSTAATMLTKQSDGGESITDGPYADTKEQIGGFYIVDVPDLDAALEIARRIPIDVGRFEVRPVAFNPSTDL